MERPDPTPDAAPRFTVLQLNDLYKIEGLEDGAVGGLPRVRALRRALEAGGRPVLVLHAGDFLFPSVMSRYLRAEPMVDAMNRLDGDADRFDPGLVVTFGSHEFDDTDPAVLLDRLAQSQFRWVASNVRFVPGKVAGVASAVRGLSRVHETLMIEVAGVRVGLLGVTTDITRRDYADIRFDRPARFRAVRDALARLRAGGARVVIALTHEDMPDDEDLARSFPEIDLIVGGHEHVGQVNRVGPVVIAKGDSDARSVLVTEVEVPGHGRPRVVPRRVDLAGEDPPPDRELLGVVARWRLRLQEEYARRFGESLADPMGTTLYRLEGTEDAVRCRETGLGNWLADVVRDAVGADVALLNAGSIRINDNIPAGAVLRREHLEGIMYYDDLIVAVDLTGADLVETLNASACDADAGHGRFLQVSGLRFTLRPVGRTGSRTVYGVRAGDVVVERRAGGGFEPVRPDATYRVAVLRYLWEHGDRERYAAFAPARRPPVLATGPMWRAATEAFLRGLNGHPLAACVEGRIVRGGR